MAKPNWNPQLKDVLKHDTIKITKVSQNTGSEYKVDVIPKLEVLSVGSIEETEDNKFKYSIADVKNGLEYVIKTENQVQVNFGQTLIFTNVRGGVNNGVAWYGADKVEIVKKA